MANEVQAEELVDKLLEEGVIEDLVGKNVVPQVEREFDKFKGKAIDPYEVFKGMLVDVRVQLDEGVQVDYLGIFVGVCGDIAVFNDFAETEKYHDQCNGDNLIRDAVTFSKDMIVMMGTASPKSHLKYHVTRSTAERRAERVGNMPVQKTS